MVVGGWLTLLFKSSAQTVPALLGQRLDPVQPGDALASPCYAAGPGVGVRLGASCPAAATTNASNSNIAVGGMKPR